KRDKIKVRLVTAGGTIPLPRIASANSDPNFVGRFKVTQAIAVEDIEGIEVVNNNGEFTIHFGLGSMDISEVVFEAVTASLAIRGKPGLRPALPQIDALETEQVLANQLKVGANRSQEIAWSVAEQLRSQFEGVNAQVEELTDAQEA